MCLLHAGLRDSTVTWLDDVDAGVASRVREASPLRSEVDRTLVKSVSSGTGQRESPADTAADVIGRHVNPGMGSRFRCGIASSLSMGSHQRSYDYRPI